ncbi:MAG: hypothetical protein LUD72_00680, partial [Bacteroidales bacterium]|nr:hypothetical protein [Bacteroidales bacterium]
MKTLKFLLVGAFALITVAGCKKTDELVDTTPVYDDAYYASYASISSSDSGFTSNSTGGIIHFKVEGGEVKVLVSCGTDWLVQNDNPASFNAYASDSYYLTVSAEQNYVEEELTGTITLTTAEMHIAFASITVTQNAYGSPEITVETNEWNAPAVGKLTTTITVDSTDEWTIDGGDEWLTVEKSGTGINLTAEENEDTEGRDTKIVLTCTDGYKSDSETITVTQDGLAYITLSEESLEFDSNGGETVVTVESNFEWEYTCESDWFSIEKDEEDGSLKITCDASEVEEDREDVVTFTAGDGASNTIEVKLTVAQGAYLMPKISVETKEWNAPAIGELTTEIGVEANFEWTFDVNADWLTAGKTEKGITLTAKENSETGRREGEVVLSCTDGVKTVSDTIAVSQDGLAYISLSEEELYVSSFGSSISVTVESNFDWECACDADWLTAEKKDDGFLSISYSKNEAGSDRETVVTITAGDEAKNIAGAELKITQSWENTDALILEYTTTSSSTSIELPIYDVTNATIDWGDGETTVTSSNWPSHSYARAGTYTVSINGTVKRLYSYRFNEHASYARDCLTEVIQWGNTGLTNMYGAFYKNENLRLLPEEDINNSSLSKISNFKEAFYGCTSLVAAPSFEGCSEATTFEGTFSGCTALPKVPENMFSGCTSVTSFESTFSVCTALATLPENMFSGCTAVTD